MIDKKKIEETAEEATQKEYSKDIGVVRGTYRKGFKAGINWFKENLWHDASEEPKENGDILVLCGRKVSYTDTLSADFIKLRGWNNLAENRFIIRWLYIEDLMEGGSNG